jgi:hypothetical protein
MMSDRKTETSMEAVISVPCDLAAEPSISRRGLFRVLGGGALWLALPAVTFAADAKSDAELDAAIALVRSDLRADHKKILWKALELTPTQSAAFEPVYAKYETELGEIYDQRIQVIKDYAASMNNMSDAKAKELAERTLKLDEDVLKLKRKYFREFAKVVPARVAARFVQVENQLLRLIDLKIGLELPLIG